MKPNIFLNVTRCDEDYFSHALAYVLNVVPGVGDRFVDRISFLAGKKPGYFGRFENCEFVGHEFPEGHRSSRPDLKLVCASRTIYFENKLDSPLSVPQMERHAEMVGNEPNSYLMFVSNIRHLSPGLRSMRRYIHPKGGDHYLWVQLLSTLDTYHRKGTLAAQILNDFRAASKLHGMVGRTIRGAGGSLYTSNSDARHVALSQLAKELLELGFKVARKSKREGTLRVYPSNYGEYPLLNPRFYATAAWLGSLDTECIVVTVISKGRDPGTARRLRSFVSRPDCKFVPNQYTITSGYTYYGNFVLPVTFSREARDGSVIDFTALAPPLKRILLSFTK